MSPVCSIVHECGLLHVYVKYLFSVPEIYCSSRVRLMICSPLFFPHRLREEPSVTLATGAPSCVCVRACVSAGGSPSNKPCERSALSRSVYCHPLFAILPKVCVCVFYGAER